MSVSRRPKRIKSARARAPVCAAFAMLAVGFTGTFAPSRAGMPTLGWTDNVEPGGAEASGAPRANIPTLNQRDSAQPGEIWEARQAETPTLTQKNSAQALYADPPGVAKNQS